MAPSYQIPLSRFCRKFRYMTDSVPATFFRSVKRTIGRRKSVFNRLRGIAIRNPKAHGDGNVRTLPFHVKFRYSCAQRFGKLCCRPFWNVIKYESEFFSAKPRDHVIFAHVLPKMFRYLLKYFIAGFVPERIIHSLEKIDVPHDNCRFFGVIFEVFISFTHDHFKPATIEESGKRVDFSLRLKCFYLPSNLLLSSCVSFALILQCLPC